MTGPVEPQAGPFERRFDAVRHRLGNTGVEALLLSVGPDLPWLTGYEAMPLERLTMMVLPADGPATLVVPALEAPRVVERPNLFSLRPWSETEDPIRIVAGLLGGAQRCAMGDTTWARFVVDLLAAGPDLALSRSVSVMGPLRAVKDTHEIDALSAAGSAADRVARQLQAGDVPLIGRTEAEVSAEIGRRLLAEGHQRVNFAIVAAGENAASPHHEPGARVIRADEVVLCDFGGTMHDRWGVGYCSDITRCVWTGDDVPGDVAAVYEVLHQAHGASCAAVAAGVSCESVDSAGREVIAAAGYGQYFVHRTGHGIGVEAHEDPYMVAGNAELVEVGHAFSIEPGIYLPGRFGFRLEDCGSVVSDGWQPFTDADHALTSVIA